MKTTRGMRLRLRLAAAVALTLAIVAGGALPAQADDTWTWSTATHPAGGGSIGPLGWGTFGGGVYRYHGVDYVPGVGHIDTPLGTWRDEQVTGAGTVGRVAYTTYANGKPGAPDIGLIATGTKPIAPKVRVSEGWQDAWVTDVAHPGDVTAGKSLCHSGTSPETIAAGGYRCGVVSSACGAASTSCYVSMGVSGGDSGGPVWWYSDGGITLYGWISGSFFGSTAVFEPVWALQNHVWTESESWSSWGYPPGNDGTGCFVTISGCVRS
ncbi:hypothetical protein [Leifsonia sp. LS-T14]|uniref:hypothetical protein n=1 Tax=unclassified Leifsonia TaxID=2663824 RepID=UPI0035A72601